MYASSKLQAPFQWNWVEIEKTVCLFSAILANSDKQNRVMGRTTKSICILLAEIDTRAKPMTLSSPWAFRITFGTLPLLLVTRVAAPEWG